MWSLPDIVRLNDEAAAAALKHQHEIEAAHPENHACEVCEWDSKETPADYGYCWFDIFSADPKGTIFLCEQHDGYTGSPIEGYFTCGECDRVFIENYTWERYSVIVGYEELCLPCALERYIAAPDNWIPLDAVQRVVLDPSARQTDDGEDGWSQVFDPENGVVNLAAVLHLIGVRMPVPDSIVFETNLELDSSSGQMLASTSSTYGEGVGEATASNALRQLANDGYERCLLILDAAYQFSVSIGIYVDAGEKQKVDDAQQERAGALWKAHCDAVIAEDSAAIQGTIREAA